jgi:hypothetical protein
VRIAAVYSHHNSVEFLQVHQPALWREIRRVIGEVKAEDCRVKQSRKIGKDRKPRYSAIEMRQQLNGRFEGLGWSASRMSYWVTTDAKLIRRTMSLSPSAQKAEIKAAGCEPIFSYNQTDYVKSRVAVEVQFGKYAFVAYDLFVKHMAFFVGDVIDVGVEILAMKRLQEEMSSGVGYYEGELYNLIRQGRGVPAVPLVLIGVEP